MIHLWKKNLDFIYNFRFIKIRKLNELVTHGPNNYHKKNWRLLVQPIIIFECQILKSQCVTTLTLGLWPTLGRNKKEIIWEQSKAKERHVTSREWKGNTPRTFEMNSHFEGWEFWNVPNFWDKHAKGKSCPN